MPNQLKMSKVKSVIALRQQGWSFSRIAKELGIHRQTVAKYVRRHSKSSEAPAGSGGPKSSQAPTGSEDSKSTQAPIGSRGESVGRSACEPLRESIEKKLDQGLDAKRIFQDLVQEHGFQGSYWSVMRFVRRLGQSRELPFRRLECEAGEEAQVDFGAGAPVLTAEGRRRKTYVFRIVLSHSRKGYSEVVYRQTTENFIRCLENAFRHFRGVPKTLVIDNLRAAVTKADWYEPELHPKLRAFCEHYGVVVLPTRPYTPRHKEKASCYTSFVFSDAMSGNRRGSESLIPWCFIGAASVSGSYKHSFLSLWGCATMRPCLRQRRTVCG